MRTSLALVMMAVLAGTGEAQQLSALWGSSSADIWALGDSGALHFDGQAWTRGELPAAMRVLALDGSAADNVWALVSPRGGAAYELLRWNGTSWSRRAVAATTNGRDLAAAIAVTPTTVYLREQTESYEDTIVVHAWNGNVWSRLPLPHSMVVSSMRAVGGELWLAGYAYFDPRPDQRNQFGVLVRRAAGRWFTNWTGRTSSDPVIGSASWLRLDAAGTVAMLFGDDTSGTRRMIVRRGGRWQEEALPERLPPDGLYLNTAILLGDGTPMATYHSRGGTRALRRADMGWEPFATALDPAAAGTRLIFGAAMWSPAGSRAAYAVANQSLVLRLSVDRLQVVAPTGAPAAPIPAPTATGKRRPPGGIPAPAQTPPPALPAPRPKPGS